MAGPELKIQDAVNETCPWSGKPIAADSLTLYNGAVVGFCNPGCRDKFEASTAHFDRAIAGLPSAPNAENARGRNALSGGTSGEALMAPVRSAAEKLARFDVGRI